mmetsp:Transcript_10760/g.29949  ORF Transcript_10760/g.29949 Transcript_10760/m.29949 type:complete len:260 (+) Transcript_10760:2633-3412(+)
MIRFLPSRSGDLTRSSVSNLPMARIDFGSLEASRQVATKTMGGHPIQASLPRVTESMPSARSLTNSTISGSRGKSCPASSCDASVSATSRLSRTITAGAVFFAHVNAKCSICWNALADATVLQSINLVAASTSMSFDSRWHSALTAAVFPDPDAPSSRIPPRLGAFHRCSTGRHRELNTGSATSSISCSDSSSQALWPPLGSSSSFSRSLPTQLSRLENVSRNMGGNSETSSFTFTCTRWNSLIAYRFSVDSIDASKTA